MKYNKWNNNLRGKATGVYEAETERISLSEECGGWPKGTFSGRRHLIQKPSKL